ncbi:CHASE2 domain-containing protein [Pyruvatibacter mobilis]|uniref:CHASE2 domain-containing protein n=1 Tax=Pyruvatibacter mobilis TaxID=1712261 RepID=UPI003BAC96A0
MRTIQLLRRLLAALAGIALVGWLVVMQYDPARIATTIRMAVFDTYQQTAPRPYRDPAVSTGTGVMYVNIDRPSLERVGPWPWPRTRFADVTQKALSKGARVVVFETPFEWPDATSPREAVQEWLARPELDLDQIARLEEASSGLPDHDAVFAGAISGGPVVTAFALSDDANSLVPVRKTPVSARGGDLGPYIPVRKGMSPSLKSLEDAASGNGARTLSDGPAADNVIRQVPLLEQVSGAVVPGLSLEAIRVAEGARGILAIVAKPDADLTFGRRPGLQRIVVGQKEFPTDADGGLWLHYTRTQASRALPAWKLLGDHPDAERLKDAIVFVSASVEGPEAFVDSPLGTIPRVEPHLQAIEQMLLGHYLWRPDWALPAEQVFLLVAGVALLALLISYGTLWAALFTAIAVTGAVWAGWFAFTTKLWLVDPALPVIGLMAIFTLGAVMNLTRRNATEKFVRAQFTDRLAPKHISALVREPALAAPEGRFTPVTALSADVRGFHRVAEPFGPDASGLASLITNIHEPLTRCVLRHDGMVDRFVGGGMNALWNAPVAREGHTVQACQAALRMVAELEPVNRDLERDARRAHRPFIPVSMSIGIERGDAVVGNLGSGNVYDFSAIGGAVNEAQLLQRLSRRYGPAIIVGAEARDRVKDKFALLEIDQLRLDGRIDPWRVYALLGDPIMGANPKFRALHEAHEALFKAYRARDWGAARLVIAECRKLSGSIPTLYDLYEERIDRLEQSPPDKDWNGVHEIADLLAPAKSKVAIGKPEAADLGEAPV